LQGVEIDDGPCVAAALDLVSSIGGCERHRESTGRGAFFDGALAGGMMARPESPEMAGGTRPSLGDLPHIAKNSTLRRVLVVDDEPLVRWSIAETLRDRGHFVSESDTTVAALLTLAGSAAPFNVVVLDLHLPDSHDLTLLSYIHGRNPEAVVILMTAFGTPEIVEEALNLGAYCVLSKPFEMDDVADLVARAH